MLFVIAEKKNPVYLRHFSALWFYDIFWRNSFVQTDQKNFNFTHLTCLAAKRSCWLHFLYFVFLICI